MDRLKRSPLDLSESKLILEGDKKERKEVAKNIEDKMNDLKGDRAERRNIYKKRHDFYIGNQGDYSNVKGVIKDTKQKRGHINQVTNYAGKTVVKSAFGLANNPPHLSTEPAVESDSLEEVRAQAVEDYIDSIFEHPINRFWKKYYRRSCFIQGEYGDVAIKTYLDGDQIKFMIHEDMGTISVGWNGEPGGYDCVIVENNLTPNFIEREYGIKVDIKKLKKTSDDKTSGAQGAWEDRDTWGMKDQGEAGMSNLPSGKNKLAKVKVVEYDSLDYYALMIEGELVQYIKKDDISYPRVMFWTLVHNIPNPPSPWSIADIDYLFDPQIELNENDNRSSDHLRVGNVQRYVAYNMEDFDPESIKTSSGQVIFVNDPDGRSRFEPLPTNINNFPDDQYSHRKLSQIYDMGLPKVNYGASGADSGRSKAIDYQSSVDLTQFKRDAWELALQDICEKIQIFGNFLIGTEHNWFEDEQGNFIVRNVTFDWADALPISQSDKIVNVANKFNMIGIPLVEAYKELGYRNPAAMVDKLRKELEDPNLMILRSKAWDLSKGLLEAQNTAAVQAQGNGAEISPPASGAGGGGGQPSPQLTTADNSGTKPMAVGGQAISSANGTIKTAQQNMAARRG